MIYVVDDDVSVRTAIRRLLLSLKLPMRLFGSAEQFLAHTPAGSRGCLILDLRLPGMSGLELQQQLAAAKWKLPTIVVSAHDDDESREAAMRLGAHAFLRKPFNGREFLASVNTALESIATQTPATQIPE